VTRIRPGDQVMTAYPGDPTTPLKQPHTGQVVWVGRDWLKYRMMITVGYGRTEHVSDRAPVLARISRCQLVQQHSYTATGRYRK
jgi:hypothetical protein